MESTKKEQTRLRVQRYRNKQKSVTREKDATQPDVTQEMVPASYVEGINGKMYEVLPERPRYLKLSDGQVDVSLLPMEFKSKMEERSNGCWEWTGSSHKQGYGQIRVKGKLVLAHRLAYETLVGVIPEGLEIDHLCRNPKCVNPSHLEPVTHQENCQRGEAGLYEKLRTHCPQGHPYDIENTYWYKGGRNCKECHREQNREYSKRVLDRLNQSTPNIRGDRAMQACNEATYNYVPSKQKTRSKAPG